MVTFADTALNKGGNNVTTEFPLVIFKPAGTETVILAVVVVRTDAVESIKVATALGISL